LTFKILRALAGAGFLLLSSVSTAYAAAGQVNTSYAVYLRGLHVLDTDVSYQIEHWGYGGTTHIRPAGMISWFVKMDIRSRVEGDFVEGGNVKPIRYDSGGLSRGQHRRVLLTYNGNTPHVDILEPVETDRDPIPDSDLPHTIDTLSGMARLLETLTQTGHCDGSAVIFDGLRLTKMTVHGPTQADIPKTHKQAYAGDPSLRCDFIGQQVAGFIKDSPNRAKLATPQPGSAWFKNVEGIGLVPIRIEFNHPKLGHVTVVMQNPLPPSKSSATISQ